MRWVRTAQASPRLQQNHPLPAPRKGVEFLLASLHPLHKSQSELWPLRCGQHRAAGAALALPVIQCFGRFLSEPSSVTHSPTGDPACWAWECPGNSSGHSWACLAGSIPDFGRFCNSSTVAIFNSGHFWASLTTGVLAMGTSGSLPLGMV